jgi:hypothetical protein
MCDWCQKPSRIVYNPKLAEKKTRMALQDAFPRDVYDRITIGPDDALKPNHFVFLAGRGGYFPSLDGSRPKSPRKGL